MFTIVKLAALSASTLAALATSLIVQTSTAQADAGSCVFGFSQLPNLQSGAVVVGGYADCRPAPSAFHVLLMLQHKSRDENWQTLASASDNQIPNPRLNIATYYSQCVPDAWQGVAILRWSDSGTGYEQTFRSNAMIVRC